MRRQPRVAHEEEVARALGLRDGYRRRRAGRQEDGVRDADGATEAFGRDRDAGGHAAEGAEHGHEGGSPEPAAERGRGVLLEELVRVADVGQDGPAEGAGQAEEREIGLGRRRRPRRRPPLNTPTGGSRRRRRASR